MWITKGECHAHIINCSAEIFCQGGKPEPIQHTNLNGFDRHCECAHSFSRHCECVYSFSRYCERTRSNPADLDRFNAIVPEHFILNLQLDCFALVPQNDSQDRFVAFSERFAPCNDGLRFVRNDGLEMQSYITRAKSPLADSLPLGKIRSNKRLRIRRFSRECRSRRCRSTMSRIISPN